MINQQPRIPDPETRKRILADVRRCRLEVQEVNLELEAISVMLAEQICQQRLQQVRRTVTDDRSFLTNQ